MMKNANKDRWAASQKECCDFFLATNIENALGTVRNDRSRLTKEWLGEGCAINDGRRDLFCYNLFRNCLYEEYYYFSLGHYLIGPK